MRRLVLLAVVASLLVVALAVGVSAEQVNLRYFMWDPEFEHIEADLIKEFEQLNPNIKVEMTALDPSNYWPRVSAMAAANDLPDVMSMSTGYMDQWAKDGLLLSIQDLVERDLSVDEYFTRIFSATRYPDREKSDMYAIPYAWVTTVLFYNKDLFDKAGVAYPTDDWTWDDFLNAAQSLTVKQGNRVSQYGFWWYGRYAQVEPWVYANGGHILNESKTRIALDDKAVEAIQFLGDLTTKYGVSPAHRDTQGIRQQDLFPFQQAAMWVDGSWNIEHVRQTAGDSFRWGIAKVPQGPSAGPGEYTAYAWPDSVAITKNTKNKEAAWEFVKFLVGKERPIESYMAGKVPIYRPTAYSDAWLQEDMQPGNMGIILELGDDAGRTTFTLGWSEWRGYAATGGAGMNGELDKVTNGEQTVAQAIEAITSYGNSVLERYYPAQ